MCECGAECVWLLADATHMFRFLYKHLCAFFGHHFHLKFTTMISIMDIIMILVAINVENNWSDLVVLECSFFSFVGIILRKRE